MSTDNFKWTTQLVNEFACKLVMSKQGVGYTIYDFIKEKQSKSIYSNIGDGKDWEIVSFKQNSGITDLWTKFYNNVWCRNDRGVPVTKGYTDEQILNNPLYSIHSVRRLSDNVVLTVGSKDFSYGKPCKILSFRVMENGCMWCDVEFENGNQQENVNILSLDKLPTNPIPEKPEDGSWLKNFEKEYFELMMKQPTPPDTPVKGDVKISAVYCINGDDGNVVYEIRSNKMFPKDSGEKVAAAIEAALNEDTVVDDLMMYKLVRDNEALKSLLEQMTNYAESWKQLHTKLYSDYADLVAESMTPKTDTVVKINGNTVHYELGDNGVPNIISIAGYIFYPSLNAQPQKTDTVVQDKPVLFTTEDGVEIHDQDNYVWLNKATLDKSITYSKAFPKCLVGDKPDLIYFSTIDARDEYVSKIKVSTNNDDVACLSLNDVSRWYEAWYPRNPMKESLLNGLTQLVKEKLKQ